MKTNRCDKKCHFGDWLLCECVLYGVHCNIKKQQQHPASQLIFFVCVKASEKELKWIITVQCCDCVCIQFNCNLKLKKKRQFLITWANEWEKHEKSPQNKPNCQMNENVQLWETERKKMYGFCWLINKQKGKSNFQIWSHFSMRLFFNTHASLSLSLVENSPQ